MEASKEEAKEIAKLILSYLPQRDAQDLMEEGLDKVGQYTNNESLEQTIVILKRLME